MTRIAVLVSSLIKPELATAIAAGEAPRRDYLELRNLLGAELLYPPAQPGRLYRVLSRIGGAALAMAVTAWSRRADYDLIVSDQEGTGLLLALLFRMSRSRSGHVMISHYLTPAKKQMFYRVLHAEKTIDCTVCYSTAQEKVAREKLGLGPHELSMILHPADSKFWKPAESSAEEAADERLLGQLLDLPPDAPVLCSAGLEFRDYQTLIESAGQLEGGAHIVIAAASPWSKRANTAANVELPSNVHTLSLKPPQLRALYRRATAVAIPLFDVDFQAGSLVAYEAMACGKPVVITRTRGQNDIVQEGRTGLYVPVQEPGAMAEALNRLLRQPALAKQMGDNARFTVELGLNLDTYLMKMEELVHEVVGRRQDSQSTLGHRAPTRGAPTSG